MLSATIVGQQVCDITNGWNGHTGGEVPMVVLTHEAPDDWPRGGVPIHLRVGIEAAMAEAHFAGDKDVWVAGATAAREPTRRGSSTRSSSAWCP